MWLTVSAAIFQRCTINRLAQCDIVRPFPSAARVTDTLLYTSRPNVYKQNESGSFIQTHWKGTKPTVKSNYAGAQKSLQPTVVFIPDLLRSTESKFSTADVIRQCVNSLNESLIHWTTYSDMFLRNRQKACLEFLKSGSFSCRKGLLFWKTWLRFLFLTKHLFIFFS